jgi:hypothetical protein
VRRVVRRPTEPPDFAVVLADLPAVVNALIRDHVPDRHGPCVACGMPGTGTPHLPWPCPLRRIAERARTLRKPR